ncbi:hypothetical protein N8450_04815, partial [Schleiferiaceae bacterium]|nr:hypothetical protein [Schleiferiaceae bacterium]
HAHINHAKALCSWLYAEAFENVFVHAFTDGRDTDPQGGANYLQDLIDHMDATTGRIASVIGRYYAVFFIVSFGATNLRIIRAKKDPPVGRVF